MISNIYRQVFDVFLIHFNRSLVLLQHLQYYEAKQSIKFQRNILNVESQPKEKENTEKIKEKPNSIENFNADLLEDVTFENEQKVQDSAEMSHKEVEKKQIKKQITIINILIALLLVGAVLIFFYL